MPFDDNLDDWMTEADQLTVADMGNAAQPDVASRLLPGKKPYQTPADVSYEMRAELRHILYEPKHIHLKGTAQSKTADMEEAKRLVALCFDMDGQQWQTGQPHSLPAQKDIKGRIGNVCIPVAKMANDMGAVTKCPGNKRRARKGIVHRQTNLPGDPGLKVSKPTKQPKTDPHRMAGATVLMGVEISAFGLNFKFFDGAHKMLPNLYEPTQLLPAFSTLEDAKLALMKAYELFWLHQGRKYNMKIAVYIARNRLTFYANGGAVGQAPPGEDQVRMRYVGYKLIRNTSVPENCVAAKATVASIALPGLFEGMLV